MFDYWKKQSKKEPLYPEVEWERPERKDLAGKLLIIGGSLGSFSGVAEAYNIAKDCGIGDVKVLVPESLRKITKDLPDITYAHANTSGSFSVKSLENMLYTSQWADGVLLSGEYGRNSETSIALSNLIKSYSGLVVLTKDSVELLNSEIIYLSKRPNSVIVCSYSQLQRLAKELNDQTPFLYSDDLVHVVSHLHEFTSNYTLGIVTKHGDYLIASHGGEVVTTERTDLDELWCLQKASEIVTDLIHFSNKSKIVPFANRLLN